MTTEEKIANIIEVLNLMVNLMGCLEIPHRAQQLYYDLSEEVAELKFLENL